VSGSVFNWVSKYRAYVLVQLSDESTAVADGGLVGGFEDEESLCKSASDERGNDGKGLHDEQSIGGEVSTERDVHQPLYLYTAWGYMVHIHTQQFNRDIMSLNVKKDTADDGRARIAVQQHIVDFKSVRGLERKSLILASTFIGGTNCLIHADMAKDSGRSGSSCGNRRTCLLCNNSLIPCKRSL
jgi:hypothetical protein